MAALKGQASASALASEVVAAAVKSALRSAAKLATTALRRCELLEGDVAAEKARAALRMDQGVLEKRLAMLETRCHQSEKRCSKLDMRADEADRRQEADERWKRTTEERLERAEQRPSPPVEAEERGARGRAAPGADDAPVDGAHVRGRRPARDGEDDDDEPVAELGRAAAAPPAAKPRNRISFAAALAAPPVLAAAAAGPAAASGAAAAAAESAGNKAESVARTHATTRRLVGDVKLDVASLQADFPRSRRAFLAKYRKDAPPRDAEAPADAAAAAAAPAAAPAAAAEPGRRRRRAEAAAAAPSPRAGRAIAAAIAAAEAAVEVENANASRQGTIEAELRALRRFQGEFEFKQEKYAERFEAGAAEHRGALATCEGIADGLERRCDDVDAHVEEVNAAAGRIDALERVATRAATEAADRATRHNLPNVLKPILRDWLEHSGVGPGVRQDELVARLGAMERELDALVGRVADGALEPRRPHPPAGTTAQVCISCNRPTGPHPEASDPFDVLDFLGGGDAPRFVPTLDVKHAAPAKAPARHPPRPQSAPPERGKLNFVNGKWQTEFGIREPEHPFRSSRDATTCKLHLRRLFYQLGFAPLFRFAALDARGEARVHVCQVFLEPRRLRAKLGFLVKWIDIGALRHGFAAVVDASMISRATIEVPCVATVVAGPRVCPRMSEELREQREVDVAAE
ncbi:hypothetical protein JL720_7160 [Aureococcus anophagefferens]|nr:hypothetical protein JL720_7160 [Aureococcus anophagefferens]